MGRRRPPKRKDRYPGPKREGEWGVCEGGGKRGRLQGSSDSESPWLVEVEERTRGGKRRRGKKKKRSRERGGERGKGGRSLLAGVLWGENFSGNSWCRTPLAHGGGGFLL